MNIISQYISRFSRLIFLLLNIKIGKNIREVIAKNGGTMPEDLPTPKKSLKQLEKENNKKLKEKN